MLGELPFSNISTPSLTRSVSCPCYASNTKVRSIPYVDRLHSMLTELALILNVQMTNRLALLVADSVYIIYLADGVSKRRRADACNGAQYKQPARRPVSTELTTLDSKISITPSMPGGEQ